MITPNEMSQEDDHGWDYRIVYVDLTAELTAEPPISSQDIRKSFIEKARAGRDEALKRALEKCLDSSTKRNRASDDQ